MVNYNSYLPGYQPASQVGILWVAGLEGARSYPVATTRNSYCKKGMIF